MPYFERIKMFGDGHNGMAMKVYSIHWGDGVSAETVDTGITKTWRRENRRDPGRVTYQRGEQVGSAAELINAWAEENGKDSLG